MTIHRDDTVTLNRDIDRNGYERDGQGQKHLALRKGTTGVALNDAVAGLFHMDVLDGGAHWVVSVRESEVG
jgi:hypothetical protein